MKTLDWSELRGPELERLDRASTVVTVAVSPLEVHGPHLPLATDALEARALLDATLEELMRRDPKLVHLRVPTLHLGTDVLPRAGSVSVRPSTIVRVVEDLARSLARQGFERILVGNFHAGPRHLVALEVACDRASRRYGARVVSLFSFLVTRLAATKTSLATLFADIPGVSEAALAHDAHAGLLETSLLLHLRGALVSPEFRALPELVDPGMLGGGSGLIATVRAIAKSMRHYQANTYAGAPATATAETGAAMLERIARFSADQVEALWRGELGVGRDLPATRSPLWRYRHLYLRERAGRLFERLLGFDPVVF
ncbi:MAG: creatininase family protein [Polyangiaceae bacterium]